MSAFKQVMSKFTKKISDMVFYLGNKTTFEEMVKSLRERGVSSFSNISNEYLIDEAYSLGEWEYV